MTKLQISASVDTEVIDAIDNLKTKKEWPSTSYTINKVLREALLSQ